MNRSDRIGRVNGLVDTTKATTGIEPVLPFHPQVSGEYR